jgi:hypothetical protein
VTRNCDKSAKFSATARRTQKLLEVCEG